MRKDAEILDIMISDGDIPSLGVYKITESMLSKFTLIYGNNNIDGFKTKSNKMFARKLAGLSLLKDNFRRGGDSKTCKEGLVYLIENPVYTGYLKVGMTIDLDKRLSQYQVYDPLKRFRIKQYEFVLDRKRIEENILSCYNIHLESGEWIKYEDSNEIIQSIRNNVWKFK